MINKEMHRELVLKHVNMQAYWQIRTTFGLPREIIMKDLFEKVKKFAATFNNNQKQ